MRLLGPDEPLSPLRNALAIAPLVAINTLGYVLLNRYHLRAPRLLPLSVFDRAIPFLPWTVWPYLLLLFSDVALPLALRTRAAFGRTLVAYGVAISINFAVWIVFPTIFPRPPLPTEPSFTNTAYAWLVAVDSPASCLPSGHITIPAVACWGLTRERSELRLVVWGGFALLALSVLTTKQHYVIDVLAGLGTALAGIAASQVLARGRAGRAAAAERV